MLRTLIIKHNMYIYKSITKSQLLIALAVAVADAITVEVQVRM